MTLENICLQKYYETQDIPSHHIASLPAPSSTGLFHISTVKVQIKCGDHLLKTETIYKLLPPATITIFRIFKT